MSRKWQIDGLLDAIKTLGSMSDIAYEVKKLQQYREGLLSLSPFKVGDRVVLVDPPTIARSSGWYGDRHFLVAGAHAEVREVDWVTPHDSESGTEGYFHLYVAFDNESRLSDYDDEGKPLPLDAPRREIFRESKQHRHVYGMAARRFAKDTADR